MGNSDQYVPDIAALSLASRAVHADARIDGHPAIAPGLHTSTTFRYPNDPERLRPIAEIDVSAGELAASEMRGRKPQLGD
jgi:hypothetical protein